MQEELLAWYKKELSFLRREAVRFARTYPQVAARLDLQETSVENPDPHVDRIIQATALLAARVRMKLEDGFPELSDTFIDLLFPHFLAPVPSMTTLQFEIDPEQGGVTTPYRIERGQTVRSRSAVDGVTCAFRTCFDVLVAPLRVVEAAVDVPPGRPRLRCDLTTPIASSIRIVLAGPPGVPVGEILPPCLRLHLAGDAPVAHGLFELLIGRAMHAEVYGTDAEGRQQVRPIEPDALRAVGFAAQDALLPFPPRSFSGFRLLQEYFALPEKFLFADVLGLDELVGIGGGERVEISVFCSHPPRFADPLSPADIRLGCTPAINLFECVSEPITIDHRAGDYLVVPQLALRRRDAVEVWSVQSVSAVPDKGGGPELLPLYAFSHHDRHTRNALLWHAVRRQPVPDDGDTSPPRRDGRERTPADHGSEMWLSIGLPDVLDERFGTLTAVARVLCTHRDLPTRLAITGQAGGDFVLEGMPGFLRIVALRQPTPTRRLAHSSRSHWKLIAHLGLNVASLLERQGDGLRGILELYAPTDLPAVRRQIAAIGAVEGRPAERFVEGALVRGTDLTVVLDPDAFPGTGSYLFALVLDRFLGMYAPINSYTRLRIEQRDQRDEAIQFPGRAGTQVLL